MTLKIVRIREKGQTRLRLSGDLRCACLDDVRAEVARVSAPMVLDLEEVHLVDIDGVRWLNMCQMQGIQLENCAPYIRQWMFQERLAEEKERSRPPGAAE